MAVLPPGTALPLALHSPRGLPSRWPLTAVLPRFCPVIGAECDSQAPTDTPGTVLCTVVLLLSTCCVQGSREREALGEARVSQAAPSRLVVSLRPPSVCCLPALCPAWAGHVFGGLLGLQMLLSRDTPLLHARALAAALSMGCTGPLWTAAGGGPSCAPPVTGTGFLSCRRELGRFPASGQRLHLHASDRSRDGPLPEEAVPGPDGRG